MTLIDGDRIITAELYDDEYEEFIEKKMSIIDFVNIYSNEGVVETDVVEEQEQKIGHCKDCKYFEYDSVAKVDVIPLIVAHEICSRWGDGCKTNEDGYCFLFESKAESEES